MNPQKEEHDSSIIHKLEKNLQRVKLIFFFVNSVIMTDMRKRMIKYQSFKLETMKKIRQILILD